MAEYIIPMVGTQGYYKIATPYDRYFIPTVRYTCQAIRTLQHYLAEGQDPYTLFYSPYGLTKTDYEQDYAEGMSIVALQAETGPLLYVPARYILSYPLTDGVAYQEMMVGVSLGSIPQALDLTALNTRLANVIQEALGIIPIVTPVQLSATVIVSTETDQALQAARAALSSQQLSDASRVTMLQAIVDRQRQTIGELEAYIIREYVINDKVMDPKAYYLLNQSKVRQHRFNYTSTDSTVMFQIPLGPA